MVEVRKSTRIKTEAPLKRRFSDALEGESSTPAKPAKAAKTTAKATPRTASKPSPAQQEPVPLILPNKLTDNTPLPVIPSPQPDDLPDAEWQDLSSSGVFAASLARSRQAIARGAFFTKFWTKPVATKKQKDMTEEEKAALKAAKGPTQSKVGVVKMTCEPLTFEVQLFMIKDQQSGHKQGQLPLDKQHLIFGTPQRIASPVQVGGYRPVVQQHHHAHPTPPPPLPPARPHPHIAQAPNTPQMYVAPSRPPMATPSQSRPSSTGTPPVKTEAKPTAMPAPAAPQPAATAAAPAPKPASATQAPDPVIHALAQRASANPELKAVMKIVATGRASPQQLQYFQKHIDELTEMVKKRQEQQDAKSAVPVVKQENKPAVSNQQPPQPAASPAQAASGTAAPTTNSATTAAITTHQNEPTKPSPASSTPASMAPPTPAQSSSSTSTMTTPAHTSTPSRPPIPAPSTVAAAPPMQRPNPPSHPPHPPHPPQGLSQPYTPNRTSTPPQPQFRQPPPSMPQHPPPSTPHHNTTTAANQQSYAHNNQQYYNHHSTPSAHPPNPSPLQNQIYTTPSTQSHQHPPHHPQPPRPKTIITATPRHILLSFAENPSERFLFPQNCILEWNSTLTEVICSFVAVKSIPDRSTGEQPEGKPTKTKTGGGVVAQADGLGEAEKAKSKTKDVWVPVTLTFRGDAATLSVLGRVAEPVARAREGMEDAIVGAERGEEGFLALRLPNEPKVVG